MLKITPFSQHLVRDIGWQVCGVILDYMPL